MAHKYYIVWNGDKSEGFATTNEHDAKQVVTGKFGQIRTLIGESFHETYGDQELTLEPIGW